MPQIDVRHLSFRGRPEQASQAEFVIADALRTSVPDDGRLILVRSLRLGRIGLRGRTAADAASAAWRDLLGSARHGGASGAEGANCVWFNDAAEARMLLLRELARGRAPTAWFWTLAVPGWRNLSLESYLRARLEAGLAEGTGRALAELFEEAIAAQCIDSFAAAIIARFPASVALAGRSAPRASGRAGAARQAGEPLAGEAMESRADRLAGSALAAMLPGSLFRALVRAAALPDGARLIEVLARGLVLRGHPVLALAPERLDRVQWALARTLRSGRIEAPAAIRPEAGPSAAPTPDPVPSKSRTHDAGLAAPLLRRKPVDPVLDAHPEAASHHQHAPPLPQDAIGPGELRSDGAGLLLTIAPLLRLGWREWLAGRPDLLLEQPGPRLLHHVAARYRVPADDPARLALPEVDPAHIPSEELAEALEMWRAGLDRWLRRKARRKLADVVRRQGWILAGPETTLVRFPLNRIDMSLRRLALDVDPGWVDWLGRSYRMIYRDRPLIGPDA